MPSLLSRMSNERQLLFIDVIFQKAFIELNQKGSEATAAATFVDIMPLSGTKTLEEATPEFNCNIPFLFLIRDNLSLD